MVELCWGYQADSPTTHLDALAALAGSLWCSLFGRFEAEAPNPKTLTHTLAPESQNTKTPLKT